MVKKKDIIICRCNDVTLEEVESAIKEGFIHPEELKRFLHIGMGPCQGRTCSRLIARILAKNLRKPLSEIQNTTVRPPLVPIGMKQIIEEKH